MIAPREPTARKHGLEHPIGSLLHACGRHPVHATPQASLDHPVHGTPQASLDAQKEALVGESVAAASRLGAAASGPEPALLSEQIQRELDEQTGALKAQMDGLQERAT